jgi:hypothetical protein
VSTPDEDVLSFRVESAEDGRELARRVMTGVPGLSGLLAELERGWGRSARPDWQCPACGQRLPVTERVSVTRTEHLPACRGRS